MISDNIEDVKRQVVMACERSGRSPDSVTIIAVTKTVPPDRIDEAVASGLTLLGENRVQEARSKVALVHGNVQWHLVGHLQSNKAKDAVKLFSLIHSVDSIHLAEAIDKEAQKIGKVQDILVQVNVSGEESKFGISPDEVRPLLTAIERLKNLRVTGFMTVAPEVENPEDVRAYFRRLRELGDDVVKSLPEAVNLSMGMTNDFEVAIEEGATLVRLGRVIFGDRG